MKKCPSCKKPIRLTEVFLEKKECPYCYAEVSDPYSLEDIQEYNHDPNPPIAKSTKFLTHALMDILYWISVVIVVVIGISIEGWGLKLVILILGNIILRISYEASILFFSLHEQVVLLNKNAEINNKLLKELVNNTSKNKDDKNKIDIRS
ncbi:hypothetical protein U472_00305 [Orenia metallireducens]|jgi:hypothetical protein|uniref:Uncharacterized protein n=1 Tax=Orenia metallireducens TaxID=1413210 RepID=A0A1C0ADA2_9FIRM|nr:hypothetical protein [Orenia metallireducens]OCL28633.1 hypothetical protein U472_00305 [Orenia metallireducens]